MESLGECHFDKEPCLISTFDISKQGQLFIKFSRG